MAERGLHEVDKTEDYGKLADRIQLLHEVIEAGLEVVSKRQSEIAG